MSKNQVPVETLQINDFRVETNKDGFKNKLFWVESNGCRIDVTLMMRPNKNVRMFLDFNGQRLDQVVSGLFPFSVERPIEILHSMTDKVIDKERVYVTIWNVVKQMRNEAKWHFDSRGVYVGNEFGESRYVK